MRPRESFLQTLSGSAAWSVAGAAVGLAFGASFGALASLFDGGPALAAGVVESARWFAGAGAVSGWLLRVTTPRVERA